MTSQKKNLWFGIGMIFIGLLTLMMFGFEIYDGKLEGSRSYGLTQAGTPFVFYLSTGLELLLGLVLLAGGIYTVRNRNKEYSS
jgi:hypothetical protein